MFFIYTKFANSEFICNQKFSKNYFENSFRIMTSLPGIKITLSLSIENIQGIVL